MPDTTSTATPAAAIAAFNASDLSTPLPADATLADLVERINALTMAVAKSGLSADQLSALNKITAFFSV